MSLRKFNKKPSSRSIDKNHKQNNRQSKNNTIKIIKLKNTATNSFMGTTAKMWNLKLAVAAVLLVLVCSLGNVNGLKCYMCGQYNEGVGSITPCLNYSAQFAHLYLKECSKKSEKFCVKYVSELSTVRDCATECVEKEIWETQTYCCNEEGCNGSSYIAISQILFIFVVTFALIKIVPNAIRRY